MFRSISAFDGCPAYTNLLSIPLRFEIDCLCLIRYNIGMGKGHLESLFMESKTQVHRCQTGGQRAEESFFNLQKR